MAHDGIPDGNNDDHSRQHRRLHDIQLAELTAEVRSANHHAKERVEKLELLIEKVLVELYGAGNSDGLKTVVSNLRQMEARRAARETALWIAVVGIIANEVWKTLTN